MNTPDPHAAQIAQETSVLTDQLNEGLFKFGQQLFELHLGVQAEVPLDDDNLLGFGRMSKGWHLYVRKNTPDGEPQYLTEVSRHNRIKIVALLPDLRAALLRASEQQLEDLKQAVAAIQVLTADPDPEKYGLVG